MFMATCKYCGQKLTQKEIDISKKRGDLFLYGSHPGSRIHNFLT